MAYIEKQELAAEIRAYHATLKMSDALVGMVQQILSGAIRSVFPPADHRIEDVVQNAWLKVLTIMDRLDAEQDAFGYLSTIGINMARQECRRKCPTAFSSAFGAGYQHAPDDMKTKPTYAPQKNPATERTKQEQEQPPPAQKRGTAPQITWRGETKTIRQWAATSEIDYHTLYNRIVQLGWPVEKAMCKTKMRNRKLYANPDNPAELLTIRQLCERSGAEYGTARERLRRGIPLAEAIRPGPLSNDKRRRPSL